MKILFHHRIRSKDGQFVHMAELTRALKRRGHEMVLVGPSVIESEPFGAEAGFVDTLKQKLPGFLYEILEFGYNLPAMWRLVRAIRREKPDWIYERFNLFFPAGVWVNRHFKLPFLLEVNAPLYEERAAHSGISMHDLARWSQRITWNQAGGVLPVTQVLGNDIASYGVSGDRIHVIPNGIDPERFRDLPDQATAKARLKIDAEVVLGFVGFIHAWHGLARVLDFLKEHELSNVLLMVVGDGPDKDILERKTAELGLSDRVTFTGTIGRDEIKDYLAAFDIALQPNVTDYASPLKLFEYMCLGHAIIAPDKDNIREILTRDHDALLIDPNDFDQLCAALLKLISSAEERDRLGSNARQTIADKRLTWDNNAERVEQLFRAQQERGQ